MSAASHGPSPDSPSVYRSFPVLRTSHVSREFLVFLLLGQEVVMLVLASFGLPWDQIAGVF